MSPLVEAHSSRNPRLLLFHAIIAALVATLVGGLTYGS